MTLAWALVAILMTSVVPVQAYEGHCQLVKEVNCPCPECVPPQCNVTFRKCEDGPESVRGKWGDEHPELWREAARRAGLPRELRDPQRELLRLHVYTDGGEVAVGKSHVPTLIPVDFADAVVSANRRVGISEFAGLPDGTFSIVDWAFGNERCLEEPSLDPTTCHLYGHYLGQANASHFLPQAQWFYAYRHGLALARAAQCKQMHDRLAASERPRFREFVLACEKEALALEAFAQHFLQDAWSIGHMWGRWGPPRRAAFHSDAQAFLAGTTAGIIHGAESAISSSVMTFLDPMCAPTDGVDWRAAGGAGLEPGLGDVHAFPALTDPASRFRSQSNNLFACSVSGLLDVYEATAQGHGSAQPAGSPTRLDPTSDQCFGQRATNRAIRIGLGIDEDISDPVALLIWLSGFAELADGRWVLANPLLINHYIRELARLTTRIKNEAATDPNGTSLANGGIGDFFGVHPNGAYLPDLQSGIGRPAYLEPPLAPSPSEIRWQPDTSAERALLGSFHRAHADDWCTAMPGPLSVEPLRNRVEAIQTSLATTSMTDAERAASEKELTVTCDVCTEIGRRYARVRNADGDVGQRSLCEILEPAAEGIDMQGLPTYVDPYRPAAPTGEDPATLAGWWCNGTPVVVSWSVDVTESGECGAGQSTRTWNADAKFEGFFIPGLDLHHHTELALDNATRDLSQWAFVTYDASLIQPPDPGCSGAFVDVTDFDDVDNASAQATLGIRVDGGRLAFDVAPTAYALQKHERRCLTETTTPVTLDDLPLPLDLALVDVPVAWTQLESSPLVVGTAEGSSSDVVQRELDGCSAEVTRDRTWQVQVWRQGIGPFGETTDCRPRWQAANGRPSGPDFVECACADGGTFEFCTLQFETCDNPPPATTCDAFCAGRGGAVQASCTMDAVACVP